jgi:nucleotide-binding universal stress UspA family protein
MFRKILLPVDRSDKHAPALNVASELAGQSAGEVLLLHVIEIISGLSLEEEKDFYRRLEKLARAHVQRLADELGRRKVSCRADVVFGNRVPEIVRYAREMGADLIVLTSPRLDLNNPAEGWGSLSYKVSLVAPCPVLLVK